MNRLNYLKQTLKTNIIDNWDYSALEFILLDYNSSDGLKEYVKSELITFIECKKLIYYRTEEPQKYNMSHSRNLAFKLATGDIVCNIDADNFTGPGFAKYINEIFNKNDGVFLSTHGENVRKDVLGRICVKRQDFLAVNGYDEKMKYYGFDDYDFLNRLQMFGLTKKVITEAQYLNALNHSNLERMQNFHSNSLEKFIIKYVSPAESTLHFMFSNGTCIMGTIVSNTSYNAIIDDPSKKKPTKYRYSVAENCWIEGVWEIKSNLISMKFKDLEIKLNHLDSNWLEDKAKNKYCDIKSTVITEEMIFFFHQTSNRLIMEDNFSKGIFQVNNGIFGEGIVSNSLN